MLCIRARLDPSIQTQTTPFQWHGVVSNTDSKFPYPKQELCKLLREGAIEQVSASRRDCCFVQPLFGVPKRDGGLRPILDLRPINRAIGKRPFGMLTLKQILAQIRPGDWFASVDLNDAYFHIQIAPHHRRFSEVCCQGKAQCTNTLLSRSGWFWPHAKCIDAALPPQIEWEAHPQLSGRLADFSSVPGYAYQPHRLAAYSFGVPRAMCQHAKDRAAAILSSLRRFSEGSSVQLKDFQRLLGLRAVDSLICHLGLLHMRPLQLWLKSRVPWTSGCLCITVTRGCIEALTQPRSLQPGSSPVLGNVARGGHDGCIDSRLGSSVRGNASFGTVVGISEPVAHKPPGAGSGLLSSKGFSATAGFSEQQHVLIRTDNTSVVSDINHHGGIRSRALCKQATDCHPLHQSSVHPRSPDPRGGHAFEEGDSSRRVEIAPRVGSDDLEPLTLRESGDGSVRHERERALPVVLLPVSLPTEGDTLTSRWPAARPYAFPLIKKCCHWCYQRSGRSEHQLYLSPRTSLGSQT